jgi:hypothetical protein
MTIPDINPRNLPITLLAVYVINAKIAISNSSARRARYDTI